MTDHADLEPRDELGSGRSTFRAVGWLEPGRPPEAWGVSEARRE